jgi:hypothetical protein
VMEEKHICDEVMEDGVEDGQGCAHFIVPGQG